ncbi:MAG: class I SAM-dependent methyltransferase [Lachnospiraceae bacterium]|nr:class I SAM-dependent methyltransferase [Lachnospiraceae bacterium]
MEKDSSTECWNKLGTEWIDKAQTNDFRMDYIMPNTLRLMENVDGDKILDLGCGEGGYSRELAKRGALVTSIDCSEGCIAYAREQAKKERLIIDHYIRNSNDLHGIKDNTFDKILCSMMLMDVEDINGTLREVERVLKPGGQVYISVLHPCFKPPVEHKWFKDNGNIQVIVKDYFHPETWEGGISECKTPVIYRHRTMSDYVKAFTMNRLLLTDLEEPIPTREQIKKSPRIEWLTKIPMYMFMKLMKPKFDYKEIISEQ